MNERDYDPLKLLSILVKDCDLQPSSIFFHTDLISKSILLSMSSEQLDSDCSVSSNDCNWTSIFKHILGKVVVLRLQCKGYGNIWVMVQMIRTATSGTNSQLKYVFCTMSNLYMDVIQPFSTLLSLQNFCQLTLEIDKLCPLTFKKLLQEFMKAPHTKKIKIHVKNSLMLPKSLKAAQLAVHASSSCSAQQKVLQLFPQREFTCALYLLLQFPSIRLKKLF